MTHTQGLQTSAVQSIHKTKAEHTTNTEKAKLHWRKEHFIYVHLQHL